jgi:hypothetical protein
MNGDYLRYSISTDSDYYGTEPSENYFDRVESEVRNFMAEHYPGFEVDVDRHPETSSYNTRSTASDDKVIEDVEAFVDRNWTDWLAEETE